MSITLSNGRNEACSRRDTLEVQRAEIEAQRDEIRRLKAALSARGEVAGVPKTARVEVAGVPKTARKEVTGVPKTARGEVAVEALVAGDLVATRFGGLRPVRWIGRQGFDGRLLGAHRVAYAPPK